MRIFTPFTILIICFCILTSCKKDVLYFQKVQKIESYTDAYQLNKVMFVSDSVGFIVGGQRSSHAYILKTTDGGYTWNPSSFPNTNDGIYCMAQSPSGALYMSGYDSKIIYTADTGKNWQIEEPPIWKILTDISYPTTTKGIAVGGISYNQGWLLHFDHSADLVTWDSFPYQLNKIKMTDQYTGYVCGCGIMLKTTDGGTTWNTLSIGNDNFYGISTSGNNIWVCGYNGSIFHSVDQGQTWKMLRNGNDLTVVKYRLYDILFKDDRNGWAVGENGLVVYTDDGGHHWMQYDNFTNSNLHSLALCANGDLIVCGENGTVFRLTKKQ